MSSFYKRWQPRTIDEVAGHKKAKRRIEILRKSAGLEGQVFWITGESGTGKNTIASILAAEVAPEDACRHEIDAQDLSLDMLRDWELKAMRGSLWGGFCFTVNEAHGLSSKVVSRLQTLLENDDVQSNSTWIFTTTFRGEAKLFDTKFDACPFLSRAVSLALQLDTQTVLDMAGRLHSIAGQCELNGRPLDDYKQLLIDNRFNMRSCLQRIAAGEMLVDQ